jgi:hypothetical protein
MSEGQNTPHPNLPPQGGKGSNSWPSLPSPLVGEGRDGGRGGEFVYFRGGAFVKNYLT